MSAAEGPAPAKALSEVEPSDFELARMVSYASNEKKGPSWGARLRRELQRHGYTIVRATVPESPVLSLAAQRERVEKVLAEHRLMKYSMVRELKCACGTWLVSTASWEIHRAEAIVSALHEER